jgi:hypothetical protein
MSGYLVLAVLALLYPRATTIVAAVVLFRILWRWAD